MDTILKVLNEIGLNKKEALIYGALLKNGKMTVSEIAREAEIKRATVYQHVATLLEKDFVARMPVGKRMFYLAANPKKILANFEKKQRVLENGIEDMSVIFNESTHKPKVQFYEGKRELKNIYEEIFESVGDMYSIFPPRSFFSNFTENDYREFDSLIKAHALKSKDLMVRQEGLKKVLAMRKENYDKNQQTKILPEAFASNVDVLIAGNRVALISLTNLSAIVIENDDIADFFKSTFNFFWKNV